MDSHGFLRYRCDSCAKELLVGFSCKERGFCPSCLARRMSEMAAFLTELPQGDGTQRQEAMVPAAVREEERKQQTLKKLSSLRASLDLD